eukprot:6365156-Pyramimonas_sp.AAC.1
MQSLSVELPKGATNSVGVVPEWAGETHAAAATEAFGGPSLRATKRYTEQWTRMRPRSQGHLVELFLRTTKRCTGDTCGRGRWRLRWSALGGHEA